MTGEVRPPTEIQAIAELPELGVETSESVEDLAPDEHPRGVDTEDVATVVVLTLVRLAGRRPSCPAARAGDLLPHLEQP